MSSHPESNAFYVSLPVIGFILASSTILYSFSVAKWYARARGHALPPGPRRLPFFGARVDLTKMPFWEAYRDLCNIYGEKFRFVFAIILC